MQSRDVQGHERNIHAESAGSGAEGTVQNYHPVMDIKSQCLKACASIQA